MRRLIKTIIEHSTKLNYKTGVGMALLGSCIMLRLLLPLVQQLQVSRLEREQQQSQVAELRFFKNANSDYEEKLKILLQKENKLKSIIRDEADASAIAEAIQRSAEGLGLVLKELKLPEKGNGMSKAGLKGIKENNIYLILSGNYEAILAYLKLLEQDKAIMDNIRVISDRNGREIRLECRINIYTLVSVKG